MLGTQLDINGTKLAASYYHHMVMQLHVHDPLEHNNVAGINNYIDVGIETIHYSTIQIIKSIVIH